jgi:long-chain acyl-CoA synthetase
MDLSRKPEVAGADRRRDRQGQCDLPDVQQVKRFLLLNKELEADDAEMTRTRKVRRSFVAEKYASVIEAIYGGKAEVSVSIEITFEDGRKSMLNSTIAIHDATGGRARESGGLKE